jgi:hypothetical protein
MSFVWVVSVSTAVSLRSLIGVVRLFLKDNLFNEILDAREVKWELI